MAAGSCRQTKEGLEHFVDRVANTGEADSSTDMIGVSQQGSVSKQIRFIHGLRGLRSMASVFRLQI
jgi:hypothetical protein